MLRTIRPAGGLRFGFCVLAAVIAVTAITTDPADARGRRKRYKGPAYSPPFASLVIDANSGNTLHATNADALRHPASLTKIMTLYMLFEQIEAGKFKLDSRLEVSQHASEQAPSKLGLRPGQTISVEEAIRALVTKSANDAAAVIAEAIGGDEETFGKMMTRKARSLGMSRTVYVNASGLPDEDQITTARDQATLGRAIQDRFPRYYRYFATPTFVYHGRSIRNHNRLLGRVEGVDGIKTGYTRASGFNLVSSVRRGSRHIVAVVLGGASGGSRDAKMRSLIEQHIASGASQRTIAKIAEAADVAALAPAKTTTPEPQARMARADTMAPVAAQAAAAVTEAPAQILAASAPVPASQLVKPGSGEPISPVKVKTISVKAGNVQTAMLAPLVTSSPQASVAPTHFARAAVAAPAPTPAPAAAPTSPALAVARAALAEHPMPAPAAAPAPAVYETAAALSVPAAPALKSTNARGPWLIQVGAFPKEAEAQERLREAKTLAKAILAKADPFTERVTKGSQELYRARFAGLGEKQAEAACRHFKKNEIACMAIKN